MPKFIFFFYFKFDSKEVNAAQNCEKAFWKYEDKEAGTRSVTSSIPEGEKNAFEFGFTKEFAERKKKKKLTTNHIQIMTVQKKKKCFSFSWQKEKNPREIRGLIVLGTNWLLPSQVYHLIVIY